MNKPSFWRLTGAYLIDWTILVCFDAIWLYGIFAIILVLPAALSSVMHNTVVIGLVYSSWLIVVIDAGYFSFLEKGGKGSLGKRAAKLKIQPASSFWKVFAAYGIDCALFVLIGICVYFYMKHNLISHLSAADLNRRKIGMEISLELLANLFLISAGALCSFPFYCSILESLFGKTLGKKICGLQVVQNVQDVQAAQQEEMPQAVPQEEQKQEETK